MYGRHLLGDKELRFKYQGVFYEESHNHEICVNNAEDVVLSPSSWAPTSTLLREKGLRGI